MALRIMGNTPPPREEEPMPEEMPEQMLPEQMEAASEPAMPEEDPTDLGRVPPAIAVYRTPDLGPFICANCAYFREDGSCILVAGTIEPEGVCNLFTKLDEEPEPEEASEMMA